MARCLSLARDTHPHPNPRVGAVVVGPDGTLKGQGSHAGPGTPHAEVMALQEAGRDARGGTIYATLEPCSHHGRTPPCVDAILAAGIRRVVVGVQDPDSRVAGSGIEQLRAGGLSVEVGVLRSEAIALDPGYFHHRKTGRPFVILKVASTLDGQVAAVDGSSRWITGTVAREDAHRLRARSDAVMVGAGTVRSDNPRLDVRLEGYAGPQPVPIIVVGSKPLPTDALVLARSPIALASAQIEGIDTITAPGPVGVDLTSALQALGERGVIDVLVEGGPTLAASLLAAGLVDRLVLYLGGLLAGGTGRTVFSAPFPTLDDAREVHITAVTPLGNDIKIEAEMEKD